MRGCVSWDAVSIKDKQEFPMTGQSKPDLFEQKCGALFRHVLVKYPDRGTREYESAG